MPFLGRRRELGLLRLALDRTEASLLGVTGPRGVGKTTFVRKAIEGLPSLVHRIPPLPDPEQRTALASHLREGLSRLGRAVTVPEGTDPPWEELFAALSSAANTEGPALVLVLDDAHRLSEARARIDGPLQSVLTRANEEGRQLHVVLVGRPAELPDGRESTIRLGPLGFRAASSLLPGSDAAEKIRAYAAFGGLPARLVLLDPGATLATNLRKTVLTADAPLREAGLESLERDLQTPSRYAAILRVLAEGEADWGHVHQGVSDLTSSGQVAPYLKRLEELGLVETRRSLDARPRARNRRYEVTDPFLAFWFRFVLRHRARVDPDGDEELSAAVRQDLERHVARIFPIVCRQYMSLDAMESLGSNAREHGSLWGAGYDLEVAGLLQSGAAFYGRALWTAEPADVGALERLDREIRETRYGFGRESRLRIVFSGARFTAALERAAARRHDVALLGPEELLGR